MVEIISLIWKKQHLKLKIRLFFKNDSISIALGEMKIKDHNHVDSIMGKYQILSNHA